jgi:membrane protease YdiL (CAAX protease family)
MPSHESKAVRFISLFYLAMGAVGLLLIAWRHDSFPMNAVALPGPPWPLHLAATIGITLAIHFASRWANATFRSFRAGARDAQRLLGNLTTLQIALVALASGFGEELLFRGWLMNETNLWISSILFGLIHVPPNKHWLYWPAFAAAMGFLLGWLYLWTGSLLFPILLHAGINFLNLRLMLRAKPR